MKKMSILAVSLLALCGMIVAPTYAATVLATDTPDVKLAPGTTGDAVFDLNDFFDGAETYTAVSGGSVTGSVATVYGQDTPGMLTATFAGDGVEVSSTVQVTSFMIGNGPAIDNNNRLAGVPAGNIFYNGIVPGTSVGSAVALDLPEAGSVSPGGVTGGAALVATIGQVTIDYTASGLRDRSSALVDSGDGVAAAGGLTATLNADGTYSLATTAEFAGAWVVTFGANDGASADGVHLVAAPAVALDVATAASWLPQPPGTFPQANVAFGANGITVTAAKETGALLISLVTVPVGDMATVEIEYTSDSAAVSIAAVAFDGPLGPTTVAYTNASGANIATGVKKVIALTIAANTDAISPAFQVFNNGDAQATVTVSSVKVVAAGAIVDYALNVNAAAWESDMSDIAAGTWAALPGAIAPAQSATVNNFSAPADGSMELNGEGNANNAANGYIVIALPTGSIVGECYVQRSGAAVEGSAFAFVINDGVSNNMSTFVPGATVPEDGWLKVRCSGTQAAEAAGAYFVAQCAGFKGYVDDLSVLVVDDMDSYFDATLLGL